MTVESRERDAPCEKKSVSIYEERRGGEVLRELTQWSILRLSAPNDIYTDYIAVERYFANVVFRKYFSTLVIVNAKL